MLHDHAAFPPWYFDLASNALNVLLVAFALVLCYYLIWSLVERFMLSPILNNPVKVANEAEKENHKNKTNIK